MHAIVVKQRFGHIVRVFDDATAARAYLDANRGERNNALKNNGSTGKTEVLDVDDSNLTPA